MFLQGFERYVLQRPIVGSSQSNLWDVDTSNNTFMPVNAARFDTAVTYANGVLSGRMVGWALTEVSNLPACGSVPETCDGEVIPRCYQGQPRFSLSVLVRDALIVGTEDEALPSSVPFSIYPNPGADRITVASLSGERFERIEVLNISGKIVSIYPVGNKLGFIDVAPLPSGIYFIRVHTKDSVSTQKFIRQ